MEITHTITVPELTWTVFCFIGLIFNALIFVRSVGDLQYARKYNGNELKIYSAGLSAATFATWVLVQTGFVVVGIVAMFYPSPPHDRVTALQIEDTVLFLLISVLLAFSGYAINRGRRFLLQRIEQLEKEGRLRP